MTSAFYASSDQWRAPQPIQCEITLALSGLQESEAKKTMVEIWNHEPTLASARKLREQLFAPGGSILAPITSTLVIRAPGGRRKELSLYDAAGIGEIVERIARARNENSRCSNGRPCDGALPESGGKRGLLGTIESSVRGLTRWRTATC